jgi:hypothetical protein
MDAGVIEDYTKSDEDEPNQNENKSDFRKKLEKIEKELQASLMRRPYFKKNIKINQEKK